MTHKIKILKQFADTVLSGEKSFEVRHNDRGYQKGDNVEFQVMDGDHAISHPLNDRVFEITYVLSGWGIEKDYVVFGIKHVSTICFRD